MSILYRRGSVHDPRSRAASGYEHSAFERRFTQRSDYSQTLWANREIRIGSREQSPFNCRHLDKCSQSARLLRSDAHDQRLQGIFRRNTNKLARSTGNEPRHPSQGNSVWSNSTDSTWRYATDSVVYVGQSELASSSQIRRQEDLKRPGSTIRFSKSWFRADCGHLGSFE